MKNVKTIHYFLLTLDDFKMTLHLLAGGYGVVNKSVAMCDQGNFNRTLGVGGNIVEKVPLSCLILYFFLIY